MSTTPPIEPAQEADLPARKAGPEDIVASAVGAIASVAVAGMILLTFVDVLGRKVSTAIPGASEIISILLGITFFAGMTLVIRDNGHIVVGVFARQFRSPLLQKAEGVVTALISLCAMVLIAWLMFSYARKLIDHNTITNFLAAPVGMIAMGFAVLSLPAVLFAALKLFRPDPAPEH